MKPNKAIAIPAIVLAAGISLAACGSSGSGSGGSALPAPNPVAQALAVKTLEGNGFSCNPTGTVSLINVTGMDGNAWSTGNIDTQEAVLVFDNVTDATTADNDMTQYENSNSGGANVVQNGVAVTVSGSYYPNDPTSDPVVNAVIMGSPNGSPSTQAPVIPAAAPSSAPAPAPTEAPAAPPTQAPAAAAPAPVYVAPAASDAWSTAVAYTNDVNAGDNASAWNMLSSSVQSHGWGGSYNTYVADFTPLSFDNVTYSSSSGDSVTFTFTLHNHSTGSESFTTCTFTVDNGVITSST